MKLFLIAAFLLATTSAKRSSVGDIVQAMLPYCTHGQMRREVKAALEECSASCSSDETATDGYYDATTGGYYYDEATTGGYYWDETSPTGYYYDTDGYYDATTDAYTPDGAGPVRSLSDRNFRKMFRKECPATHYMQNKFYGGDLSTYKVLACVEERMNEVSDGEVLRSGASLRYGCAGEVRSGAAVRSGCEEVNDCIYRIESQILAEPDWCSAGLDVFPMVAAMCNSIAFMDSCFDHMRQQFVERNGYMDQTTTSGYYDENAPDGSGPVRSLN